MAMQHRSNPSPSPSTKIPRKTSSQIESMVVDPPLALVAASTGRDFPDEALSYMAENLRKNLATKRWRDDGTDTALNRILPTVYHNIATAKEVYDGPESFLSDINQVKENTKVAKKGGSDFFHLLRKALKEDDWGPLVTHDVFHIVIPDNPTSAFKVVPRHFQEEAVTKSWETPFVGTRVLKALENHIAVEKGRPGSYAPYCSIVQSSGMGKSRLLDEFSKRYFLIPVNLRRAEARGFPPPDNAVRELLTKSDGSGESIAYTRSLHFLVALFERTASALTKDLKEANGRSERITKFREFMTDGQTMADVGEKRQRFYNEIVDDVERMNRGSKVPGKGDVARALNKLLTRLDGGTQVGPNNDGVPGVFIAFDEAQSLTEPLESHTNQTPLVELCRALQTLQGTSSFSFFLSTTSKVSQFTMLGDIPSLRMNEQEFRRTLPFSDLGFDHLMHDRKVFDKFKTIDAVTSADCVLYMGRPLWGTIYGSGQSPIQDNIISFAIQKLLCGPDDDSGRLTLTPHQECAVLSQRLALDINNTVYIASGSTTNYDMAYKAQLQIANYMRVCMVIPNDLTAVRGVAASEPILSEAASHIMRGNYNFNLANALLNVLDSYAISHGDRGELLVAAFFMRARDLLARQIPVLELFPYNERTICPIFSVKDLLSNLFQAAHFNRMLNSFPSVRRADFSLQKFDDVFGRTNMHFNHLIKPFKQKVLTRPHLVAMMARGAAALGANGQFGFDMVYPFLHETRDLAAKKVGFIVVRVENHATYMAPDADLFRKMDPFHCGLLSKEDRQDFTVPIIRIVFALGGGEPSFEHLTHEPPEEGAATFDRNGQPQFTSYDFWCSGISPGILKPVDEDNAQKKWEVLLGKTDTWGGVFSTSKDPYVRRSQYPAGGIDSAHYDAWVPESHIPRDLLD